MMDDLIRGAHKALVLAIADLREMGVDVPITLYLAVHSLSYAIDPVVFRQDEGGKVLPFPPTPKVRR